MTAVQLQQYDRFLDENDWDIYYWATQEPSQSSRETAEGSSPEFATPNAMGKEYPTARGDTQSRSGEWAQTVGTFKPAYRPVPQRWRDSEILEMLRKHVRDRSAGAMHGGRNLTPNDDGSTHGAERRRGGGLGRMPEVKTFDV